MAYFIFQAQANPQGANELYKIAADDTEKNNLLITDWDLYITSTVSTDDYNKIRFNNGFVKLVAGSPVITDLTWGTGEDETNYFVQSDLEQYVNWAVQDLQGVIDANPSYSEKNGIETYLEVIHKLDFSTISYPMTKSWETYCQDESINFYNPLQVV